MRLFSKFIAFGVMMAVVLESRGEVTFRYCENDDGDNTITLLRCVPPQRNLDKFVIPSTYQGKTVTRIGKDFFDVPSDDSLAKIKSVVLPDTVWHLDKWAFFESGLTSVTIPATLTSIDYGAFSHNPVKVFKVSPDNPRYIASDDGKLLIDKVDHVLKSCGMNPGTVRIPEGIEKIEHSALEAVTAKSIEFPTTLRELATGAIFGCQVEELDFSRTRLEFVDTVGIREGEGTKTLRFPSTLRRLAYWALSVGPDLRSVYFSGGVPELVEGIEFTAAYCEEKAPEVKSILPYGNVYAVSYYFHDDVWRAIQPKNVTTYVPSGMGWDEIVASGTWMNCPIKYVGGETDQAAISCPGLSEGSLVVGVAGSDAGIPLEIATPASVKSVKASKLPSGLKLVKDRKTGEWSITGAPKKAGVYNVVLTATMTSGAKETITVPVTVNALPAWAAGTFGGSFGVRTKDGDDDFKPYGTISLKVAATGRITAKLQAGGKTYSFSAKGFSGFDEASEACLFEMTTKSGDVLSGKITESGCLGLGEFTPAWREQAYEVWLWRNEHGKDGRLGADATGRAQKAMDAIKALKRVELATSDPAWGTVAVTIDKKGKTKISGKTADGVKVNATSFLMLDDGVGGDSYHVISDFVFYDKKSKRVYSGAVCWLPRFGEAGNVAGLDADCDRSLSVYPFE